MEKQKSIKLNFVMNAILSLSSVIFPFITFPYISRVLKPGGCGKVNFVTAFITYFAMVAQLGIPTYGIRACSKVHDDKELLSKTVQELVIINLGMTILSYVVLFFCIAFVPRLQGEKELCLIISSTLLFNVIGMEWLYKGLEQYSYITIRSIIFKCIALIAMFLLVHEEKDYILYGAISIFAASASNVMNFIHSRKLIHFRKTGQYDFKQHIKPVFVFFAMSCAITVYTNLDNVMLGFMTTDIDVGYYHAAVKVKTILVSVVTSLGTVLLPRASYYVKNGRMDEFYRINKKALNFVFLAATSMMVYFMLFAREGIVLLSGDEYLPSTVPMQIIMPTLLLIGITNILGIQILVPLGKEKEVLYSVIAGAVVDLVINFILIGPMRSSGAAIGTLAAEAVVLVVQAYFLRNELGTLLKGIAYWKMLFGIGIGLVGSVWVKLLQLPENEMGSFIKLAVSAVLFFGLYGGVLLITKEQVALEMVDTVLGKLKSKGK